MSEGTITCWGCGSPETDQGQCEDTARDDFVAVGVGTGHTCGLTADGAIDCWGCGEDWQFDLGQCEDPEVP